ncbi:unnamed protein product [Linum trigynum]|uniref:Uncharacterized protein n=1 Tax=Linum trigynum TaxID=586398 RepID=A0AAV2CBU3_9ROSI
MEEIANKRFELERSAIELQGGLWRTSCNFGEEIRGEGERGEANVGVLGGGGGFVGEVAPEGVRMAI